MPDRGTTRRAALAGTLTVAAAAAVGCRPFEEHKATPAPDPDDVIRQRVLASKQALLARYAATLRRHPTLESRLAPLVADHQAHVRALNGASGSGGSASPSARSGGTATPSAPAVPSGRVAARSALADAERAAADERTADVLAAGPRLARVLASVAACEATHAALLRGES